MGIFAVVMSLLRAMFCFCFKKKQQTVGVFTTQQSGTWANPPSTQVHFSAYFYDTCSSYFALVPNPSIPFAASRGHLVINTRAGMPRERTIRTRAWTRFMNFLRDIRFFFLCLIGRRRPSGVKIVVTEPTPLPTPPSESSSSSSSSSSDDTPPCRYVTLTVESARYGRRREGRKTVRVMERGRLPHRELTSKLERILGATPV
ncbi:hypothetical protein PRIPAC_97946 [Pristionchus pacificus]|uniref:Uncharacterized protein n=1 Tax=Pristionchus pacificus TaxID=54126 RepID=A0A2A6BJJ1_PRIPA|nr:hypothetical protein PRIPAC_97946 [Pristionchus pacificus]|eukprot:PDM66057.1 hypothetical protein PRIPAC_45282 [Pristionchus pacificus]